MARPALLLAALLAAPLAAAEQRVILPCTADTSIVLVAGEERERHGARPWIRLKGNQHLIALDFDWTPLAGKRVRSAELRLRRGDAGLRGITVQVIPCRWNEAEADAISPRAGVDGWGAPDERFPAACARLGAGSAPLREENGWYLLAVDPDLVQRCVLGQGHGLALSEHDADYRRNPTVGAREGGEPPELHLGFDDGDGEPRPMAPPQAALGRSPWGFPQITASAPAGFRWQVEVAGRAVPDWNLPPLQPGRRQLLALREVDQAPGAAVTVRAVDRLGRAGPITTLHLPQPRASLPEPPAAAAPAAAGPGWEGVAVVPALDAWTASGRAIGSASAALPNPVCDGRALTWSAVPGEVVAAQVLVRQPGTLVPALRLDGVRSALWRLQPVTTPGGLVGDPLVPVPALTVAPGGCEALLVEAWVPFDARPGVITGTLTVGAARIPVRLEVGGRALPRAAGFVCELNGYGMPDSVAEFEELQRLAYERRCHVNLVPYSHRTAAADARRCNLDLRLRSGRRMDEARFNRLRPGDEAGWWDDFAEAFGPYLSGSLFADGHRGAIPAPGFYLPFHESWPLPLRPYWSGDPDPGPGFARHPEYAATFTAVLKDFLREARQRRWTATGFQVFLNNKGDPADPAKGPWTLDEPASFWDYRALGFYGALVRQAKGRECPVRLDFRIDLSRPEHARGQLDGVGDLWVVSGDACRRARRLVLDGAAAAGTRLWEYGGTVAPHQDPWQTWAWVLDAWLRGADGVVPWQTVDQRGAGLATGDACALLLWERRDGATAIRHSRRLLAYLQAQQDIELLTMGAARRNLDRSQIAGLVAACVDLGGRVERRDDDDAGTAAYPGASAAAAARVRRLARWLLDGG